MKKLVAPFRWAGSKAKLTTTLFEYFKSEDVYIEPFLGSGIVLFRVLQIQKYKRHIVNDINISIISLYTSLQKDAKETISNLETIKDYYNSAEDKEALYYDARSKFNEDKSDYALFWLLMKADFNGLYRENKKGYYNVPFGRKKKITLDVEMLEEIARLIADVEFYCMDYKEFYEMLSEKSMFAYNDPPYCQSQNYTSDKFSNQELSNYLLDKDYHVAISDVDTEVSNNVYAGYVKNYVQSVNRVLRASNIHEVKEVLYTNY